MKRKGHLSFSDDDNENDDEAKAEDKLETLGRLENVVHILRGMRSER